jgi:hypothetical protein
VNAAANSSIGSALPDEVDWVERSTNPTSAMINPRLNNITIARTLRANCKAESQSVSLF